LLEVSRLRRRTRHGASNPSRKFGKAAGGPGAREAREGVHGGRFGFVLDFAGDHAGIGGRVGLGKEQLGAVPGGLGAGYFGADLVRRARSGRVGGKRATRGAAAVAVGISGPGEFAEPAVDGGG